MDPQRIGELAEDAGDGLVEDAASSDQRFKADRDEARAPLATPATTRDFDNTLRERIDRLERWQLVRDGRVLMRRYPTTSMRASLALAGFVAEVAAGHASVEPEIVVGLSSIQVRLITPETGAVSNTEVSFAEAIDFLEP